MNMIFNTAQAIAFIIAVGQLGVLETEPQLFWTPIIRAVIALTVCLIIQAIKEVKRDSSNEYLWER